MVLAASIFGGSEDLLRNDPAVRSRDLLLLELARNALLDKVPQSDGNLGDLGGGNRRLYVLGAVLRENWNVLRRQVSIVRAGRPGLA
jgi:hypothetical protein